MDGILEGHWVVVQLSLIDVEAQEQDQIFKIDYSNSKGMY